jgi:UDP-glucose 4-epimerase
VFASSKGAYGSARGRHGHPDYEPLSEDDPCFPVQLYDHAKLFCEGLGTTYRETGGPEFVALRFATIYGPGKLARHGPMALASRLIEDSLAGRSVVIASGGDQKDEYIYVRDVAGALVAAALKPSPTRFSLYNAGSGRSGRLHSTAELAEAVRSIVPWSDIQVGPGLDPMGLGIAYYFLFDSSRARDDLRFEASYDLDSGIRDYVRVMETLGISETVG